MQTRKIGPLTVSAIGLGCMGMAGTAGQAAMYGPVDRAEAIATIHHALDIGINFFDTAEIYGPFANEELVAEALAYGDMGLALPILAPGGVASALTHFGSADQQGTYLSEFAGDNVPQACVAITEPHPLFDPTMLKTTAVRTPSGYRLDGVKSLVPAAGSCELLIVAAQLDGRPTMFIVEASSQGVTVKPDPSMGIRAAALGHTGARWLAAAALDRSLMYAGLPQKYGTNIVPDGVGWRLWDVDPATTDAERLANDVPTLVEMQARAAAITTPQPDTAGAPEWLRSAMRRRGPLPPE
jgi:hypothetical protein